MKSDRPPAVDPDGRNSIDHVSGEAAEDMAEATSAATPNYRVVALIIACALFMENLDATVLTTALPTMARDFGVPPPQVSVTITAYLLALAMFIPVSGFMADRFGARNVFRGAILIFVAGSIICAVSPSLLSIAAARFLQGMGGAMMVPVGRLVLIRTVPKSEIVAAQAWLLMPGLAGTIAGPPVGGLIVTYLDWRWIFWINVPIGVIGLFLVGRFIGDFRQEGRRAFDFIGFLIAGLALGALLFGFELVGPAGNEQLGWPIISIGLLASGLYLWHARRTEHAILDFSLLRIPTFRLATIGGSLTRITQGAQPFLLSLMLQLGFGFSAAQSGSITLATAVGTFSMKSFVPAILKALGYRQGLIILGLFGAGTYAVCGFFRPGWPLPIMFAVLVMAGFFMSFQFTAYNTIAYDDIPAERMSSATSFYSTFQQVTLSLGVCTAATVLQVATAFELPEQPGLPDFALAFWVVSAISLCSIFANLRFHPRAGEELAGIKPRAK